MSRRVIGLVPVGLLLVVLACSDDKSTTTTPPLIAAPRSASELHAVSTSPARIVLRWRDNSSQETGFRLERRIGEAEFARLDTAAVNVTSFEDRTVAEGESYTYRVVAYRFDRDADPSNAVTVLATAKEPPDPPFDPVPTDGASEVDGILPITLAWTGSDPAGEDLVYDVYFGATLGSVDRIATGQTDTTLVVPGPFERNSHYFWRVVARDRTGVSARSAIWGFNTPVDRDTIPEGNFVMGDTLKYLDPDSTRLNPLWHPGNPIPISFAYSLDRYLVTNQQYADFLNQKLSRDGIYLADDEVWDPGVENIWIRISPADTDCDISFSVADSAFVVDEGREKFPVVQVTWFGANAYARFYDRRLPRESEWEKAARGTNDDILGSVVYGETDTLGLGYPYPWGAWTGDRDLNRGNFRNSGDPYENEGRVRTTPVGFYDGSVRLGYQTGNGASPFGVSDMSGNVWEWTDDWHADYQSPHVPPATGQFRVIRGGSFDKSYGSAATWNRSFLAPGTNDRAVGFRTAK